MPLSQDAGEIARAMGRAPERRTALHDAVLLGLREIMKSKSPRRARLVVTGGMDSQGLPSFPAQIDRLVRDTGGSGRPI